ADTAALVTHLDLVITVDTSVAHLADAGMNSEENRHELAKACGKYLLATRMASVKEIKDDVILRPGRYKIISTNLHAKEIIVGDGVLQRRYIVCYNPEEEKKKNRHRKQVISELKKELISHPEKIATAQWAIKLKASGRYGRFLRINKENNLEIDQDAIRNAERMDGKWVIQTNDDTISVEDAATGYKSLLVIERCFRSLKSTQIRMMPLHHRLPERIEAHVKICVLALLIERVAERACDQSWFQIREILQTLQVSEYHAEKYQFLQRNLPTKEVLDTLKKLEIPLPKRVYEIAPVLNS
ncbi:MAG: transposase, partial [Magnetococcales bacterium]|nr:transposase [Magnetococcales bacterium]